MNLNGPNFFFFNTHFSFFSLFIFISFHMSTELTLHIDSGDRKAGTIDNFSIDLTREVRNVHQVYIKALNFPFDKLYNAVFGLTGNCNFTIEDTTAAVGPLAVSAVPGSRRVDVGELANILTISINTILTASASPITVNVGAYGNSLYITNLHGTNTLRITTDAQSALLLGIPVAAPMDIPPTESLLTIEEAVQNDYRDLIIRANDYFMDERDTIQMIPSLTNILAIIPGYLFAENMNTIASNYISSGNFFQSFELPYTSFSNIQLVVQARRGNGELVDLDATILNSNYSIQFGVRISAAY